ncbi:hypothetical protein L3X38_039768 [Prunus dulcis]|uniref:Uncharacterized protein n=1 Tax=Prunus dulcis TaxID=3755 RepID=A0AAD4V7R9_PRUDU|nr:hypothetical protein L3X38_039768 [Prunus dulcis]
MSSSSDTINEDRTSEFWNRGDEESCSEDDISDSDDGLAVKNLARSKLPKKVGISEKIECLQRLEERYYPDKSSDKQINKPEKNAISDTLREASKQRLQNALKQAQQRLGNLKIEVEKSASFLENECYDKYGKTGKSFYYSQVASTVRWLSSADYTGLTNRLGTINSSLSDDAPTETEPPAARSPLVEGPTETSVAVSPTEIASPSTRLPPIPSFSQFINTRKTKDNRSSASEKKSPNGVQKNLEKRMRLQ